ncbi:hypothetical protein HN51_009999 [Arachis hypogaea]|uniref:Dof zinc finger protein n=1 Tax=Arachis hypogaea TaxID=3818 RepID=A0A445E4G7_ARAHY|nr:dof zinc finger protein DOF2.1 [Arachis hypogaea]QHO54994.1 Dof zinc finger protein [Arachis hypogaea]RYR70332.1 hypothetical protein Ahy_A03g016828 [Arachis hypogaea]
MDPSSGQQNHQQMANNNNNQSLESMMLGCTKQEQQQEKKPRPQPEQALKCPRCDSTNTKFCYYNNYSLSQPRYFCKSCRRYWTKGGTLRNVPVGGGCRKNKRSCSSSSKRAQDQLPFNPDHNPLMNSLPPLSYDSEFTLALARLQKQTGGVHLGLDDHHDLSMLVNHTNTNTNTTTQQQQQQQQQGFLDALRSNGFNSNTMHSDLYYGGNGDMGEVYNEIMLPYEQEMSVETTQAVTVTTTKQELCNVSYNCNNTNNNNKVLWGFPWQINGETNMLGDIDLSRASWNGNGPLTTPLSWHGLLNSPLM